MRQLLDSLLHLVEINISQYCLLYFWSENVFY